MTCHRTSWRYPSLQVSDPDPMPVQTISLPSWPFFFCLRCAKWVSGIFSHTMKNWTSQVYTSATNVCLTYRISYLRGNKVKWWHRELWFVYLRYMLPKRLQIKLNGDTVSYGLYTSGICYPRGYKLNEMVTVSYALYTSGTVHATQEVTKRNGDSSELWFVYFRYMLPKR